LFRVLLDEVAGENASTSTPPRRKRERNAAASNPMVVIVLLLNACMYVPLELERRYWLV